MRASVILAITALWLSAAGCAGPGRGSASSLRQFTRDLPALGTHFHVVLYAADQSAADAALATTAARLADLDTMLNPDRPDSELRQLCDAAGSQPRKLSDDLFAVLDQAQRAARASGGAFDVTAGPYLEAWRRASQTGREPTDAELEALRPLAGWEKLQLEPIERTASLATTGMRIDPAPVARGYAADAIVEALKRHGVERAMVDVRPTVNAGRTVVVSGPPPDRTGWPVKLEGIPLMQKGRRGRRPKGAYVVTAANAAVAFSANNRGPGGQAGAWLLDPLTGKPADDRPRVVVVDRHGARAAALAAAAAILGREPGNSLVRSAGAMAHFAPPAPPPRGKASNLNSGGTTRYNKR